MGDIYVMQRANGDVFDPLINLNRRRLVQPVIGPICSDHSGIS
jgi:hypothetical protein